jgi:hypothetical protein
MGGSGISQAAPTDYSFSDAAASTTYSSNWLPATTYDNNMYTVWSSNTHSVAQSPEWLALWFSNSHSTFQSINYVKLATRLINGNALGFPIEFTVSWSDGSAWHSARGFTHFQRPTSQWVTLTLPNTVNANGIMITANVLGDDMAGNYVFQLADAKAGYDPDLNGVEYPVTSVGALTGIWPPTNLKDNNLATMWSSNVHTTPLTTEWISYWWSGLQKVNYIKLRPRFGNGTTLSFPTSFTVSYQSGSQWITANTYTNFPTPLRDDWIILPLKGTVSTNGIHIVADGLGRDDVGNYVFQLAEAKAGYNAAFDQFKFTGNNGITARNEIQNVGSQSINRPNQINNWNFDERGVIVSPSSGTYRNIYAPFAVNKSGSSWNIYFGGWDGESPAPGTLPNDRVSMTTTNDNFMNISNLHSTIISNGTFQHANNECVFKVSSTDWRMVYTTLPNGSNINKPGYATSLDGVNWTPAAGSWSYLLNMSGYSNWIAADVNGGNTIYREPNGTWHLYFIDNPRFDGIHHATSTDFINYTYVGDPLSTAGSAMTDFKPFSYGGNTYYMGLFPYPNNRISATVSMSLSTFPPLQTLFTSFGNGFNDNYFTTAGWVQDGQRIFGVLYGAAPTNDLLNERIFARWLQKKVIFENSSGVRWGDVEYGYGPDRVRMILAAGNSVETGRFSVYDTDGSTLLYQSPLVTMRSGDVWSYSAGY